jgi:DNA-binding Xre family transcriptional regulator
VATVSYKRLWHLLIEREISKGDLQRAINCSSSTMAKLGKNELVSMQVILNICECLNCNIEDIIEIKI